MRRLSLRLIVVAVFVIFGSRCLFDAAEGRTLHWAVFRFVRMGYQRSAQNKNTTNYAPRPFFVFLDVEPG